MTDKKSGIYCIENLINGKKYIGQSIDLHKRELGHFNNLKNNRHANRHLQNAYNKYGRENFVFEIIEECVDFSKDGLTKREQFYVDKYINKNSLYNICLECVDSNKGVVFSDKARAKISQGTKGANNGMYGKRHSKKSRQKISESQKGQQASEEARKNMSIARGGKNNPNYGRVMPCNARIKIMASKGITKNKIVKIKKLLDDNVKVISIVERIGCSESTVYKVKNGGYDKIFDLNSDL